MSDSEVDAATRKVETLLRYWKKFSFDSNLLPFGPAVDSLHSDQPQIGFRSEKAGRWVVSDCLPDATFGFHAEYGSLSGL